MSKFSEFWKFLEQDNHPFYHMVRAFGIFTLCAALAASIIHFGYGILIAYIAVLAVLFLIDGLLSYFKGK